MPPDAPRPHDFSAGTRDPTLKSKEFCVQQKHFYFDLKQNWMGRYLRITEVSGGRSAIVIPEAGWREFARLVGEIAASSGVD